MIDIICRSALNKAIRRLASVEKKASILFRHQIRTFKQLRIDLVDLETIAGNNVRSISSIAKTLVNITKLSNILFGDIDALKDRVESLEAKVEGHRMYSSAMRDKVDEHERVLADLILGESMGRSKKDIAKVKAFLKLTQGSCKKV